MNSALISSLGLQSFARILSDRATSRDTMERQRIFITKRLNARVFDIRHFLQPIFTVYA